MLKLRESAVNVTEENENLIEDIRSVVEDACKRDTNIYGYGIWTNHITRVVKYSKLLAEQLSADAEIVEIAALLHDYAGIRSSALSKDHHIHGAIEADRILSRYGYPRERIEKIKHCILSHRGSVNEKRLTPEAECVASADAMAHICDVPSLLYLTYTRKGMDIGEGAKWVNDKIDRSWNKLCPEAKVMVKRNYDSAKNILGCEG